VTPHTPKTAALEALAAGLLSEDGERRLRKHLAGCGACREHFATIHVYRDSQEFILQSSPEIAGRPLDWSKMELALAREAKARIAEGARTSAANSGAYPWLIGGAVAVAAVALVAIGVSEPWGDAGALVAATMPSPPAQEPAPVPPEPEARIAFATGVVSMLAGRALYWGPDGADEPDGAPLEIGQRVLGGTVLTNETSQAQLVLSRPDVRGADQGVTRIAIGPGSRVVLGQVDTADVAGGAVSSVTAALLTGRATLDSFETSARTVVLAGSYRVEIRAARCTIELGTIEPGTIEPGTIDEGILEANHAASYGSLAHPRVVVSGLDPEVGEVVVVTPDGDRHSLANDQMWSSGGLPASGSLSALALAPIEGALVSVQLPDAVRFEIGEDSYVGGPSIALHVSTGPLSIRAFDSAGHTYRTTVDVGPDGLALTPDQLEPVRARVTGFLPPEDILSVVRQSQRALQRCYEQALRLHPSIQGGRLRARVTLDSQGTVRTVRLEADSGQPMPDESLEACVRREAALWHFPSPGGPMIFDLPLRFTARQ
jgi:hypothetical protein